MSSLPCNSCEKPVPIAEAKKYKIDGEPHCKQCFDEIGSLLQSYQGDMIASDNNQKQTKTSSPSASRFTSSKPQTVPARATMQNNKNSPGKSPNSDRLCEGCGETVPISYAKFCSNCGRALSGNVERPKSIRGNPSPYQSPKTTRREQKEIVVEETQVLVLKVPPKKMEEPKPVETKKEIKVEEQPKQSHQPAQVQPTPQPVEPTPPKEKEVPKPAIEEPKPTNTESHQQSQPSAASEIAPATKTDSTSSETSSSTQPTENQSSESSTTETSKSSEDKSSHNEVVPRKLQIGVHSDKGRRKKNEDAHAIVESIPEDPASSFFGVFDGHGGSKASAYCSKKLCKNIIGRKCYATDRKKALTKGFIKTDQEFLDKFLKDGCTAVVALLLPDNHLLVANAGDSRCVVCQDGQAVAMTKDHKPNDEEEQKRIEAAGHDVMKDTQVFEGQRIITYRIDGVTAVSRSIGDLDFKDSFDKGPEEQAVTCVPDITETDLKVGQFFVLACDGLFDVMTNQEVIDFVLQRKSQKSMQEIAVELVNAALDRGSQDNVSALLVALE